MEIVLQQWMYIYIYNILYVSYFSYIYNIFIFWDAPPATVSTRIVTCMGPLLINFSLAIVIATGSIPGYIIYIHLCAYKNPLPPNQEISPSEKVPPFHGWGTQQLLPWSSQGPPRSRALNASAIWSLGFGTIATCWWLPNNLKNVTRLFVLANVPTHISEVFEFISTGSPKILFRQQEKHVWVSGRLKQIDLGIWGVQKPLTCHHGEWWSNPIFVQFPGWRSLSSLLL